MSIKWDWWKSEPVIDVESTRAEFHAIEQMVSSDGWKWLNAELVNKSNALAAEWMQGGHDLAKHERLAGQVKLIGEILDWPNERAKELVDTLKAERDVDTEQQRVEEEDISLSPVPNEPEAE